MLGLLEQILKQAMERVSSQLLNYAPGVLAAIFILVISIIVAKGVRWLLLKIIKGIAIDRFLSKVGLHTDVDTWKTPQVAAQFAYVLILALGALSALDSFNSELTSRLIETTVMLCPKLLIAAAIIVISAWVGRYFSRSTLIWAVNENLPAPRKLATVVRIFFIFCGVVVAADHLDFARTVFITAFVLILGGAVLSAAIALGINGKEALHHCIQREEEGSSDSEGKSLWKHL
jgi:hypothetical protein